MLGLVVGSFLNVVIYRLPIMMERQWRADCADIQAANETPTGGESLTGDVSPAGTEGATDVLSPAVAANPAAMLSPQRTPSPKGTVSPESAVNPPPPLQPFTLSVPRSACPACKAPIKAWQNIPVVSWLVLRGRCAACHTRISLRYPLVELATGLLSAWVAWHFGFGATAACAMGVTWTLIALTGIDIDHQLLPDGITLPLLWAGLVAAAIGPLAGLPLPGSPLPVSARDAILGAAAGFLSLWLVYHAFRLVTGKEGMGYGDFKLLAALGAWLGWQMLPVVILLSAATGAVLGIAMIVLQGRDRAAPIPFGPYLAAAGWIAMMYGDPLVDTYMRVSGLRH